MFAVLRKREPKMLEMKIYSDKKNANKQAIIIKTKEPEYDKTSNAYSIKYNANDLEDVIPQESEFNFHLIQDNGTTVLWLVKTGDDEYFVKFCYPLDLLSIFGSLICHFK